MHYGGRRKAQTEKWGLPGRHEVPRNHLGFPTVPTGHLFNSYCMTHFNFPVLGADCWHVIRTSGWQNSAMEGHCLQTQNDLDLHVPQSLVILLGLSLHENQLGNFPDTKVQSF